jgi:hypothetical protein
MSTETSELNQPNDGGDSDEPRWRFGFRHADTGVDDADRDAETTGTGTGTGTGTDDEDDTAGTAGTVYDSTDDQPVVVDSDEDAVDPQPTFTPSDTDPATTLPSPRETDEGRVVQGQVVPDDAAVPDVQTQSAAYDTTTYDDTAPVSEPVLVSDSAPVAAATPATDAVPASGTAVPTAAFDPSAPLLGDPVTLRANWQQAAAEFVDDPRAAVADAAELVEQTAQTLIGALQQRQRQMRGRWETGTDASAGTTNGATTDTEELRHLMQNYRTLFNQLTAL